MRRLIYSLLFLSLNLFSSAQASTIYTYKGTLGGYASAAQTSKVLACQIMITETGSTYPYYAAGGGTDTGICHVVLPNQTTATYGYWQRSIVTCPYGDNGGSCNESCDAPSTVVNGQCVAPAPDPCFSFYGQSKGFTLSGNSNDPGAFYKPIAGTNYWSHPNSVVLGGCGATVEIGTKCNVAGDGAYTCTGNATHQGVTADPSAGETESDECTGEACPDTEPSANSGGSSECTNWVEDAEGRRTRTCETTAEASQSGQAACLTSGALVCVKASPTPEKDTKTRTDAVSETPTADGGKSTETTSTTNKTYCAAGACTTTTTTNHSVTVTNGSGEVTSETGTCDGDDCADPQTEEEEKDEAPKQAELPAVGEEGDPGYGESLSNFTGRVQSSPLISAVSGIAFPSSGGSCFIGSASLWGGSISFNSFCTMAPDVLGGLRYLFLSIWAVAAVRLFMTA